MSKSAEIRNAIGRLDSASTLTEEEKEAVASLAQAWEKAVEMLGARFYDDEVEYEEWADGPAEEALKDFLFWWTWGN